MKNVIHIALVLSIGALFTGSAAYAMRPTAEPVVETVKADVQTVKEVVFTPETAVVITPEAPVASPAPIVVAEPTPIATPVVAALENETAIWNRLIHENFSRNQVAGIMGNLQQEHNFNTSDAAGGLGIAQWTEARRLRLMAIPQYLELGTQLNYLIFELRGTEKVAGHAIGLATSVEEATVAFQNNFERCGVCMENQRVGYAYAILARH